jgi:hypothetical protein
MLRRNLLLLLPKTALDGRRLKPAQANTLSRINSLLLILFMYNGFDKQS